MRPGATHKPESQGTLPLRPPVLYPPRAKDEGAVVSRWASPQTQRLPGRPCQQGQASCLPLREGEQWGEISEQGRHKHSNFSA